MSIDGCDIYQLILERNALETTPFLELIASNTAIHSQSDSLQSACELAKHEIINLRFENHDIRTATKNCSACNNDSISTTLRFASNSAAQAALSNETHLREKIEQLEEESTKKDVELDRRQTESVSLLDKVSDLHRQLREKQDVILHMKEEHTLSLKSAERLSAELDELMTNSKLADQQEEALKCNLRNLQKDNETIIKDNKDLESQLLAEKRKSIDEVKRLNDVIDELKSHIDMLRSVKRVNEPGTENSVQMNGIHGPAHINPVSNELNVNNLFQGNGEIPSSAKLAIQAHSAQGTCLVFDRACTSLIATSGADSTIKIWDSSNGSLRTIFRGSYGNSMTCCDIVGNMVVGAGSDKTCRIWNISAERLVGVVDICQQLWHHLNYL
jgi:WD domain, G-beta repeat